MHVLDHPIWQALNSADQRFNLGDDPVAYFPDDISPFASVPVWDEAHQLALYHQLPDTRANFVIVREAIDWIPQWDIRFTTLLDQMICEQPPPSLTCKATCRALTMEDVPAMLALTAKTKPGPFEARTILLGNYHGVFEGKELAAMAGERLHLDDYTEISAVCTEPAHAGKGYAAYLVAMLAQQIQTAKRIPFLHVKQDNTRAITMYERLGFRRRAEMYFAIFKKSYR